MGINETLEAKRKDAKRLVSEIEKELSSVKSIKENIKKVSSEVSTETRNYKKIITTLNRTSGHIENSLTRFKAEKAKISQVLKQAESYYQKQFIPLKNKIDNPTNGLKVTLTESKKLTTRINTIKLEIEKKYTETNTLILTFKKSINELKPINSAIKNLHTSSLKNNREGANVLAKIIGVEKQAQGLLSKMAERAKKSEEILKSIKVFNENSQINHDKIETNFINSEETLSKIQEVYDIAASTGRSGEFENRRNKLKGEVTKWERRVFLVSLTLAVLVLGLFLLQLNLLKWDLSALKVNFYLRFILLSPVIYYLIFCNSQYNKAQKLFDKYSFKTTLAMSVKHHIELLIKQEQFIQPGQIEKVLDFVLDAFSKIYSEPYKDEDYKMKVKLANIELELENKMKEIFEQNTPIKKRL